MNKKTVLAPKSSTSLQTILAAEAHLAEGQFFLQEQILNKSKSLEYQTGTRRPTVPKRKAQNLEPR
jgi:hypothetical protein